ncbi:MAG: 3-oxoacyl-ACP reductase family protein [Dehalococcoidia bacterium]
MAIPDAFSVQGRTAIVTGASRGIGRGIALVFGGAGANVVVAARSADQIEGVKNEIESAGGRAIAVKTDVAQYDDLRRLVEETKSAFGGIDILVNNAAASRWSLAGDAHEMSAEDFDVTMNVNMRAPFLLTQLVGREMIARGRGGAIVNITSIGGWMGIPHLGVYSASKAALMRWSESTAAEWGQYGIRINCVGPGFTKTDETRKVWDDPDALAHLKATTPLGRPGEPEDIAYATLFLASRAADFITGQTLYVEGGWAPVRPSTGYRTSE